MRFWLRGAIRQWQRHRFFIALLVAGYALSIALPTLVIGAIAGAASRESDIAMGDPLRLVAIHLQPPGGESITVDLNSWLQGLDVSWVRAFFWFRGAALSPSLGDATVVAFAGSGPLDWSPPLRSGRFITAADMRTGARVMVAGEGLSPVDTGYQVIGVASDQGWHRGWDRDVFVPLGSLPPSLFQSVRDTLNLTIELRTRQDLQAAARQVEANLRSHLPRATFLMVSTGQDQMEATAHRFQAAFVGGYGLSAVVLALVVANVGTLSAHWVLQRRRQLAVRLALGATVRDIVRMIVFEHALLGLFGAFGAAPIVWAGVRLAGRVDLPVELSGRALVVGIAATLLCGLLSALVSLKFLLRTPLTESLHLDD